MNSFGRFVSTLLALLLIIAGVALLLENLGFIDINIIDLAVDFWPLVFIAVGAYLIWLRFRPQREPAPVLVSEGVGGAGRAELEIEFGAGELDVRGLEGDRLLLESTSRFEVEKSVRRAGDTVTAKLRRAAGAWFPSTGSLSGEKWQLLLSKKIPLALRFNVGACRAVIDLTDNRVDRVEINTGASDVTLRLPRASGLTQAIAKGGAASIRIEVPNGVAAKIVSKGGLSSLDIDQRRFPKTAGTYVSPDYETAAHKADIEIDTGVSGVSVV